VKRLSPQLKVPKVDASQGVQAQSISVFHSARERGLKIIPVLNKVDYNLQLPPVLSLKKKKFDRLTFQQASPNE
jgi:translation elongation factor EF-4